MSETGKKHSEQLRNQKSKTVAFFEALPDEIWQEKLYSDGAQWTVYQVLVHLVEVESSLGSLFAHIAAGGGGLGEDFDIDDYNKQAVESFQQATVEELLVEFSKRRDTLIEWVAGLKEQQFQNVGGHPFLGQARLDEMLRLFYLHVNLHIRDIRKISKG